ncbi:MAG: sigma 54-interacting transcriptional regulator [Desulfobacterales bacterium]|nr:sigma 54-interacting transcriptional regulator [Desulfobacterales bacterium]
MVYSILVIDDEEDIRFAFKRHLKNAGYKVFVADSYHSALTLMENSEIDIVIADILLGEFTGIDVLDELRKREILCPIILITGAPEIKTASEAVRLGAFDYVSKPIRKEQLLKVVSQALNHKMLVDEKETYKNNLEAIFASMIDAVITVDNDMCVLAVNKCAEKIFGFQKKEVIGKYMADLSIECLKSCRKIIRETLENKKVIKDRRIICRQQDYRQVLQLSCSPLRHNGRGISGAVLVVRDETRLFDLEKELLERNQFYNIIGGNQRMQEIYRLLQDLSQTDTTVIITGESGTGKELVARALHYESPRQKNRMVSINCSALPENLLESELFGYKKGAFTGADRDKAGRFQLADGGTIFLDEIGDISPRIQLLLLRVIQEREFERVGDVNTIRVDVRIIVATNKNLKEKVKSGNFREDLYYRLKVMEINLPPLRERVDDIPLLVSHFLEKLSKKHKRIIDSISDDAMTQLIRYPWPGNVRELEHVMEYAFVICRKERTIMSEHLPSEVFEDHPVSKMFDADSGDEREQLLNALKSTDWNKAKAARLLGVNRRTIYRKMRRLNIDDSTESI